MQPAACIVSAWKVCRGGRERRKGIQVGREEGRRKESLLWCSLFSPPVWVRKTLEPLGCGWRGGLTQPVLLVTLGLWGSPPTDHYHYSDSSTNTTPTSVFNHTLKPTYVQYMGDSGMVWVRTDDDDGEFSRCVCVCVYTYMHTYTQSDRKTTAIPCFF